MASSRPVLLAFLLATACAGPAGAGDATRAAGPDAEGARVFEAHIRPVLVERCTSCHGADRAKGGLRLDTREGLRRGGDGGPIVVPGDPEQSRLIRALRYHDEELRMPPKVALPAEVVDRFEEWVRLGAPDPRDPGAEEAVRAPGAIDVAEARRFWSFRPVADGPVPTVDDGAWPLNDVDRFVLARLEARELRPVAPADRRTLIRRATFDLTGLPPAPEEVDAFLADPAPDPEAFARVVDRLLASPRYGERWGRHWLDLVRYADTAGDNADFPVPDAYRYRNYVIDALNRDTPYDRFVREQVAGDLLPAESEEQRRRQVIATGYLATCRRFGSHAEEFHLSIEDVIDNAGKVFLGLSVACARCHDHKFDPIPQTDYYALYGIFESTTFAFPGTEGKKRPKDFVALGTPEQAEALRKFEAERHDLDLKVYRLRGEKERFQDAEAGAKSPGRGGRTLEQIKLELADAAERLRELEEDGPPAVERAFAVSEGRPHDAPLHKKGDPGHRGDPVPRGFLQVLGGQRLPDGSSGSGRLELARWLTDPANPLTARVMVNRIWQHHFGRGLVATPNDFGARGRPPAHPELLDWLAARFVADGWSIKAMHRRLMLSRAYQLSGDDDPMALAADPANELRWRFDRRRLSAEEIRDAMLAVSGTLDPTAGGPHPFPPVTAWAYTQHKPFVADYDTDRRSVYLFQQRLRRHPYLEIFDGADTGASVASRPMSTTAIQALYLMNAPFVHRQADALAVRVGLAYADEAERIGYAYRLAYGRPPTDEEVEAGRAYLRDRRADLAETDVPADRRNRSSLASYLRALLSSNEFLFVD